MNDAYDSQLRDCQQVLNESEPFYEGEGEFRIEFPGDPERLTAVVDRERFETVLDRYLDECSRDSRSIQPAAAPIAAPPAPRIQPPRAASRESSR